MSITYDGPMSGGPMSGGPMSGVRVTGVHRPRRAAKAPVRLTRRGRLTVVLALLFVLVAGFSLGMVSQASGPSRPHVARTVTVQPGESLWQVATRVAPDADPRLVVDQLVRINHLPSAGVAAGQQLVVPSS